MEGAIANQQPQLPSATSQIDPAIRLLFQQLSQFGHDPIQTLSVIEKLRRTSWEDICHLAQECHRNFVTISNSARSSQISTLSRQSLASSRSSLAPEPGPNEDDKVFTNPSQSFHPLSSPRVAPRTPETDVPLFCFTCGNPFKSQSALVRHREGICERKIKPTCPKCPWSGDRLIRHYAKAHRCDCFRCGQLDGERICGVCKAKCTRNTQQLTAKKAWGCPYCVTLFSDVNVWSKHCINHYEVSDTWSFRTMICSLLSQPGLEWQCWEGHDWERLEEKQKRDLRETLQRFEIPAEIQEHADYVGYFGTTALLRYISSLRTSGQPYPSLNDFSSQEGASLSTSLYESHPPQPFSSNAIIPSLPPSSIEKFFEVDSDTTLSSQKQTLPFRKIDLSHTINSSTFSNSHAPPQDLSQICDVTLLSGYPQVPVMYSDNPVTSDQQNSKTQEQGLTSFKEHALNDFDQAFEVLEANLERQRRASPSKPTKSFLKQPVSLPVVDEDSATAHHSTTPPPTFLLDPDETVFEEQTLRQTRPMSGIEFFDYQKYTSQT